MTTKMGSVISVSLETCGQERTKQYATLIRAQEQEKAAQEKALAASAAASPPPPSIDSTLHKQSERSHPTINHKITNHVSQSSYSSQDHHRTSKCESSEYLVRRCTRNPFSAYSYKRHNQHRKRQSNLTNA